MSSPTITCDKTPEIISFLLRLLPHHHHRHRQPNPPSPSPSPPRPPFFLGLSGIQGSGKTTLTTHLHHTLTTPPHSLRVLTLSIDDLYLPHAQLSSLSAASPTNPFLRQRGPPGTHDVPLGEALFENLAKQDAVVKVPRYDKSAHGGQGDRVPPALWGVEGGGWDVVVLEGWCVGFMPVGEEVVGRRWGVSRSSGRGGLGRHELGDLVWLDRQLGGYLGLWGRLDALVQIDAEDLEYVYDWRIEQEHNLITSTGSGMTDAQVRNFVDSYMPSYELYLPGLQSTGLKKPFLKFTVGRDRSAKRIEEAGVQAFLLDKERGAELEAMV